MASTCTALHISDQQPCAEVATSLNGFFCRFHSRQCQALYKGYKSRNARLDALVSSPPTYLAQQSTPFVNQTFSNIKDEISLQEIHGHLFLRFQLLERVIRARKLHHSRFFAQTIDYRHQHYLDRLQSQKGIIIKSLEKLESRTAEVLYNQDKWFKWVQNLESDENARRETQKAKIKWEAALFQRHPKEMAARMKEFRVKEDGRRQAEYLESAYEKRLAEALANGESLDDEDATWDPIEDVVEDERGNYVNLIHHLLWHEQDLTSALNISPDLRGDAKEIVQIHTGAEITSDTLQRQNKMIGEAFERKATQQKEGSMQSETSAAMRQRLSEGMVYYGYEAGWMLRGASEDLKEAYHKTAPLPDDEIEVLLNEVGKIKELLFCRSLLAHPGVLMQPCKHPVLRPFLLTSPLLRLICAIFVSRWKSQASRSFVMHAPTSDGMEKGRMTTMITSKSLDPQFRRVNGPRSLKFDQTGL